MLPAGTHVQFKIGMLPSDGGSFAFNLRLCTILPFDNCYGSPPVKMESMVKRQPGGFPIDLHVAPFGISLRSEKCEQLTEHIKAKIPHDSIALHITHSNDTMAPRLVNLTVLLVPLPSIAAGVKPTLIR